MELKDIYIITNEITGEQYVGQSKCAKDRFTAHLTSKDNLPLHQAIRVFGKENFSLSILEKQISNFNERERFWIEELNTIFPNGYNLSKGGNGYPHQNGCNCYQALINHIQLKEIIDLLEENKISMPEIAKKYNVKISVIYGINYGWHYKQKDRIYPIRKIKDIQKQPKKFPVLYNENIRKEIKRRLEQGEGTTTQIGLDFGVGRTCIEQFNQGKTYYNSEWNYPLRKFSYRKDTIQEDELNIIRKDLIESKKSIRKIACEHSVTHGTIMGINTGKTKKYYNNIYIYPLRKK